MQSLGWTGEAPSDIKFARAIEAAHGIEPQQRKPLTDEQLNIIGSRWHLNLLGTDEKAELFAFARAIEAAHGIKE